MEKDARNSKQITWLTCGNLSDHQIDKKKSFTNKNNGTKMPSNNYIKTGGIDRN